MFITLYFQIFLLVSFFEKRKKHTQTKEYKNLSTTIIVPCYNEERTVQRTIESLLGLDYPKDKLTIMVIDDGSTDGTWNAIQAYTHHENVTAMQKENEGSKFAALNFALTHVTTELVGVLDADSWVAQDALIRYMEFFDDEVP